MFYVYFFFIVYTFYIFYTYNKLQFVIAYTLYQRFYGNTVSNSDYDYSYLDLKSHVFPVPHVVAEPDHLTQTLLEDVQHWNRSRLAQPETADLLAFVEREEEPVSDGEVVVLGVTAADKGVDRHTSASGQRVCAVQEGSGVVQQVA